MKIFSLFSKEVNYYLYMSALFTFGNNLSAVFLTIFLWKLDSTYTLLAYYSFVLSLIIIISFWLCAWLAKKITPMNTLRIGILFYIFAYLITLIFRDSLSNYIIVLGIFMGLAVSLFAVGSHMVALDMIENEKRDKFLYLQGVMTTFGGLVAPLVAGFCIQLFQGMTGYFVVFFLTCLFLCLSIFVSLPIKGKKIEVENNMREVLMHPSKKWKWMYPVMFIDGIFSGVYITFLISIMIFMIAGNELNLGIFNTGAEVVSIIAFLYLAKISNPNNRLEIFTIGSLVLFLSSIMLSTFPVFNTLIIYMFAKSISMNMIQTSMNALIYDAIESDPNYKKKRLDYVIIREIPLGLGRLLGIVIFIKIQQIFPLDEVIPISFSIFPVSYVLMIPLLYYISNKIAEKPITYKFQ